ncbi:serine/threonine-protein kinase [Pirellulales bacterium]|nr:serine/threonine-protein kinase [Pirellulales bacterium]
MSADIIGKPVRCMNGEAIPVQVIGRGGFGVVYLAKYQGDVVALKIVSDGPLTESIGENILSMLNMYELDNRLTRPIDIVHTDDFKFQGYVMEYLDPDVFRAVEHCMQDMVRVGGKTVRFTLQNRLLWCIGLVHLMRTLHSLNRIYVDVSANNFLVNVATGEVRGIDPDNLSPPEKHVDASQYASTPGYGDPLILTDRGALSIESDLYSLAVLLFKMLLRDFPTDGKLTDTVLTGKTVKRLQQNPVFIFDPKNTSNAATPETAPSASVIWPLLPRSIQRAFTKTFTDGISVPEARTRESEWLDVLESLADQVVCCESCEAEYLEASTAAPSKKCPNPECKAQRLPFRLTGDRDLDVVLYPGKKLYQHHTGRIPHDFSQPTAEVFSTGRQGGSRLGVRNLTQQPWVVRRRGATGQLIVPPGKGFSLQANQCVAFTRESELAVA